jgi:hypothetical protein
MSSNTDAALEPKVEASGAGPELTETETKLATEPMHGDMAATSEETQGNEKADTSSAAPVSHIFPLRVSEHAVWSFQLTGLNTDFDRTCYKYGFYSC